MEMKLHPSHGELEMLGKVRSARERFYPIHKIEGDLKSGGTYRVHCETLDELALVVLAKPASLSVEFTCGEVTPENS